MRESKETQDKSTGRPGMTEIPLKRAIQQGSSLSGVLANNPCELLLKMVLNIISTSRIKKSMI